MVSFRHGRFREQAKFICQQFVQDPNLPIGKLLSDESITQALTAIQEVWLDRVHSPLVTLWVFLTQVLSADHSCRAAVVRLIAHRVCRGERPCSAETDTYCQARKRLRCKTPELVRKEIWTHILAYNLIRTIMAQAAIRHQIEPRTISFKGTVQTLIAFHSFLLPSQLSAAARKRIVEQLLDAIVSQRVGGRPDRFEPRLRKRRNKKYDLLMKPRNEVKRSMAKQVSEN